MKKLSNKVKSEIINLWKNSDLLGRDIAKICNVKTWVVFYIGAGIERLNHRKDYRRKTPYGEKHYSHKLSEDQVKNIIGLLMTGHKQWYLAKKFNVNQSTISCIARGKTWKQLYQGNEVINNEEFVVKSRNVYRITNIPADL